MKYEQLGSTGPVVSRIGFGTMTFGAETDAKTAHAQLDFFRENGGTFIDTSDNYGRIPSEEIIGDWLVDRGIKDEMIIATKGRFAPPLGSRGASRRALRHTVERSLRRLKREAIDLYFIHGWDKDTPVEETLDTLGDLRREGKIHSTGWSNVTGWQLQRIISAAQNGAGPRPVAVQPQYNLLDRMIELEVMPCALEAGIGIVPWSPLGGGWLTGKYRSDERPTGATRLGEDPARGVEAYDSRNIARTYDILAVMEKLALKHSSPLPHIALAWLMHRPGVVSVLAGARTLDQLRDNLSAHTLTLEPSDMTALTQTSAIGLPPYPYGMIEEFCNTTIWKELGTNTIA